MILVLKKLLIRHSTHYVSHTNDLNRKNNVSSGTYVVGRKNCMDVVKITCLRNVVDYGNYVM